MSNVDKIKSAVDFSKLTLEETNRILAACSGPNPGRKSRPRKGSVVLERKSWKYKIGQRVIGFRRDGRPHAEERGILVRIYSTINGNGPWCYKNPAFVVRCDSDARERVFQNITAE